MMAVTTFTEENYLKTIYALSLQNDEWISTNALAESTLTRAASVTDMIGRLAQKGLLHYQKYKGVRLTEEGEKVALLVIRKHRLWEVFLVEKLHFGWDEVHAIAEELEHIQSERLVQKLDEFLGHPQFDPHGDPIPDPEGKMPPTRYLKLSELPKNQMAMMMGVSEHSPTFLQYLDRSNLCLGCTIEIIEVHDFDKSVELILNQQQKQFVSHDVAKNILVR